MNRGRCSTLDTSIAILGGRRFRRGVLRVLFESHWQSCVKLWQRANSDCQLATGSSDRSCRLWDVEQQSCRVELEDHSDSVLALTMDGMMKTGQRNCSALLDVVLQLPPGRKEQKSYYLQVGPVSKSEAEGDGFRSLLNLALAQANLESCRRTCSNPRLNMPLADGAGRILFRGREIYAMGWAGQAEAPGYAFQVLGSTLGRPELSQLAIHSLDVLAQAPFKANGFMLALNGSTGVWEEGVGRARMDLVSQGQAMGHFARAIAVGRSRGVNTSLWDAFHL
eukprot:s1414_g4.t1